MSRRPATRRCSPPSDDTLPLDALQFVLGDLADIGRDECRARPAVTLADTQETFTSTAPDHLAHRRDAEERRSRLGLLSWRHVPRDNFRWEINGTEGDLVLTSPVGNLRCSRPGCRGAWRGSHDRAASRFPAAYDLASACSGRHGGSIGHAHSTRLCRDRARRHDPAPTRRTSRNALRAQSQHAGLHYEPRAVSGIAQRPVTETADMR